MTIYSTSNLPKLLNGAKDDGWRILGAAAPDADSVLSGSSGSNISSNNNNGAGVANDNGWDLGGMEEEEENDDDDDVAENDQVANEIQQQQLYSQLHQVETGKPTILVLGSEGEFLLSLC